jgi:transposase
METRSQLKEKDLKEKRLTNRLRLATTRIQDVERERIWAIATAHCEGLSIRKIAEITDLSSSRVHQLLHTDEARQIPDWLLSGQDADIRRNEFSDEEKKPSLKKLQQQLADEGEVIRWCIGWLEQLDRGEKVVVNLRAESDPRTAYVGVNQDWVLRVLKRIAANLDRLSGNLSGLKQ